MATAIDKNQYDYLNSLVKAGGGNGEWAKSQLSTSTYTPVPQPSTPAPTPSVQSTPSNSWTASSTPQPVPTPSYQGNDAIGGYTRTPDTVTRDGPAGWSGMTDDQRGSYMQSVAGANQQMLATPMPTQQPPQPKQQAPMPQQISMPQQVPMPQIPQVDYAEQARVRTAEMLQHKKTISDQQKGSLDASFQRQNQITNDNRTLQDFSRKENVNPFSGRTAFDTATIGRERTLADETANNNLLAQKANIDQLLADYENATADEQLRIADELQRADRAYSLSLAQFQEQQNNNRFNQGMQVNQFNRGNFESDRNYGQQQSTIDFNQGFQRDQFNRGIVESDRNYNYETDPNNPNNVGKNLANQLSQLKIDNFPTELAQQAKLFEQQYTSGQIDQETAQFKLDQLRDPNSPVNRASQIDMELKQLELQYAEPEMKARLEQLKKATAQIGAAPYQSELDKKLDQVRLEAAQEELRQMKIPKTTPGKSASDFIKEIDSSPYISQAADQYGNKTGGIQISNPTGLETYIYSLGLDNAETYKLLLRYGLVK